MHSARNRFKVLDIEFVRVKISVPSHNIKRMRCVDEIPNQIFFFYFDEKFSFFIDWFYKRWRNNVPFTKRRMFQKLPKFVSVALWRVNRRVAFKDEKYIIFTGKINFIDRSSWNDKVIAAFKIQISYKSFKCSCALVNVCLLYTSDAADE